MGYSNNKYYSRNSVINYNFLVFFKFIVMNYQRVIEAKKLEIIEKYVPEDKVQFRRELERLLLLERRKVWAGIKEVCK